MYTITKEFSFEAAHSLPYLPPEHKCHNVHGHSYRVVVELQSLTLNPDGFVEDYRALDDIKQYLDTKLDHHNLNDILPIATTAEGLSHYLFDLFSGIHPTLVSVKVSETAKTWAEYRPDRQYSLTSPLFTQDELEEALRMLIVANGGEKDA
jgi:6-pyruvoyltetrahydropterin/6-carboxytetrahydropterin synthase